MLSGSSPSPSPAPFDVKNINPAFPSLQTSIIVTSPTEPPPTIPRSSSILVKQLPATLFSELSDLHPLLAPYGDVKKLEIHPSSSGDRSYVSAIVEYASPSQAVEAAQTLHGQVYFNRPLTVEFLPVDSSKLDDTNGKIGLNPRATPFIAHSGLSPNTVLASVTPIYPGTGFSHTNLAALSKSGLLAVDPQSLSPYATPLLYVPFAGVRPSSAPTRCVSRSLSSIVYECKAFPVHAMTPLVN